MEYIELFALLLVGHALADYPLQGEFLSKAKNHRSPIEGIPWWQALFAHSVIHGGFVGIITGSLFLGIAETILHSIIDRTKCEGIIGFNTDQALHIFCKILWVIILINFGIII